MGLGHCICQFLFGYMSFPVLTLIWKPEMLVLAMSFWCYLTRLCNLKRAFKILAEIIRITILKIS